MHGHKMTYVSRYVWKMALVELDSGAKKMLCKMTVFLFIWQTSNFERPLLYLDLAHLIF